MPRIAVVHPLGAVRALAAQILEGAGFLPIEGETIEDVLEVVRADPPRAVIIDEALARGLPPLPVPWIALGHRGPRAFRSVAGAVCVVDKPFAAEELVRAVRWALAVYAPARS